MTLFVLLFGDNFDSLSEGYVAASSEWAWIFFCTYEIITTLILMECECFLSFYCVLIMRSILTAVVVDGFIATFEVKKLVRAGHQTAIQLRIHELQDVSYDS